MGFGRIVQRQWGLAAGYGLSAAISVHLTRFDGGVAFLWASTAILIAALLRTPGRRWAEPLAICAATSITVTGVFGMGWSAALPFAIVNMGEATIAAWLLRRLTVSREPLQSLGWFFRFVFALGIVAPLTAALTASALLTTLIDAQALSILKRLYAGHALGNLTFTPLALLVTGRRARKRTSVALAERRGDVLLVLPLVAAISMGVFAQDHLPLLFLPVLAIILATLRAGREGAAISIVILALVGGFATVTGSGPVQMVGGSIAARMLFLQFYMATTVLTILPVSADLQNRRRVLRKVRLGEAQFRLLADHSTDIIMHLTVTGRIRYVSPAVTRMGGHLPADLTGRSALDLVAAQHVDLVRGEHQRVLAGQGDIMNFRFLGRTASGDKRWFETYSRAVMDDNGAIEGVLSVTRNVHEQIAREESLSMAAFTDALTGLPNRRAFRNLMENREAGDETDCIALLDIDHFKRVNDTHGHATGDDVLRIFGAIARRVVRNDDYVARIGGEEFAILFPSTSVEQAIQVCDRLRQEVSRAPLAYGDGPVWVTVSGGVARLGTAGVDHALKTADNALYRAKQSGRDRLARAA